MPVNFVAYGPVEVENVHLAKLWEVPLVEFNKKVSMTVGPFTGGIAVGQTIRLDYDTDQNCYMNYFGGNLFRCMNPRFRAVQS